VGGVGSRELLNRWKQTQSVRRLDKTRTQREIVYEDPQSSLRVTCTVISYAAHPAADYALLFENRGTRTSPVLSRILPLDTNIVLPRRDAPVRAYYSRGGGNSPEDYRLLNQPIDRDKPFTIAAKGGRSSNTYMPWYNLNWPGGGILVAIGWSGQWQSSVTRGDKLGLKAGMEDSSFVLAPGEQVRTPRVVLMPWSGEEVYRSYNLWRRLMFEHYSPRVDGKLVFPPVAKNTAYDDLDVPQWRSSHSETTQLQVIRAAAPLGVEAYWLDAYWFHDYFPKGVGNWQFPIENAVRPDFPNGLKPLADEAHKHNMKFILWFEPERVAPGTWVDRNRSEWLIRLPDQKTHLFRLDLEPARRWMTRYIIETLKGFDADVFRIDFNVDPLPFWRAADAPDRKGMTEIRHIEGLYDMWDRIRASKPGMWIDNCASGGRRNDLETMSRSLPLWRSDFNDTPKRQQDEIGAIADQVMTMGLSLYVPLHAGPVWRPQPYYWRSAMSAGNIIYWDLRPQRSGGEYAYDRELTRKAIAECKALRPYYLGDYYPLTEMNAEPSEWAAYQYVRESQGDGFAVFFRRPESPSATLDVRLRGIEPSRTYEVSWFWSYEAAHTKTMKGAELQRFRAEVPDRPGSLLIRFQRQ
jgi:alpha-galactosidase